MLLKKTDLLVTARTLILFNFHEIHIEVSSKCTLKCPRCPRTELKPEQLNQEISLAEFRSAFPSDVLAFIHTFAFCGDVGDPIYATEFLDIIKYLKINNKTVRIVTNGSYKSHEWWSELGNMLTEHDNVTFSVDGWGQASNEQYRVNSNFKSICNGLTSLRAASGCNITWSTIIFKFNEDNLTTIENLAKSLGVDHFQTVNSTKFGNRYLVNGVDPLQPVLVNPTNSYIKYQTNLTNRPEPLVFKQKTNGHLWAKCLNWETRPFINVDGLVFPCAWFNSGYQENDFVQKYKDKLNIKTRSLADIVADPIWEEFQTRLELAPLEICKIKCKNDR